MGRVGQKIKGFFQKVGRGIKKAAVWTWDKVKRVGKGIWKGVKWAAKNVVPIAGKVLGAISGGSGKVGAIANAVGAIGNVIGGKAGNTVSNAAGKVQQVNQNLNNKIQNAGGTFIDKANRIKKVIHSAANQVSTA